MLKGYLGATPGLSEERGEDGDEFVGIAAEADVGEVDSVNGSFVVVSRDAVASYVVEIFGIFGFEAFVVFAECGIFFGEVFGEETVKFGVGVHGTFYHDDGDIGASFADDVDKIVGERVAHVESAVGDRVDDVGADIFD